MDYLVLGSNGFAQVGDPDYSAKNKIELRTLLDFFKANYTIHEPFVSMAYYSTKSFVSRNYNCTENGKLECTENGNNSAQLFYFQK